MGELQVTLQSSDEPGFIEARFDYFPPLIEALKALPGPRWDPKRRCWLVPAELQSTLFVAAPVTAAPIDTDTRLYPYQNADVSRIINDRRFLLLYEPGVGKTPPTIVSLAKLKPNRTLIVCPAIVRQHWESELDKWWPEHPPVERIMTNAQAANIQNNGIYIVSYEIMGSVPPEPWDAIVLDEIHYIKNKAAKRAKAASQLIESNSLAYIIGLTGTPITSEPLDIHNIVNTVWPRRFGGQSKFGHRYCKTRANKYAYSGNEFFGLNDQHSTELNNRLAYFSSRVTKAEVAHLLPVLTTELYRYEKDAALNEIVDLVEYAVTQDTHVCVLTHEIQRTYDIADALANVGVPVYVVNGTMTADERIKQISVAKLSPNAVLIATMHSITTGIDLTKFTRVFFAQLYWSPAIMMQTLGRFPRINARGNTYNVTFMARRNTQDELIARALRERVESIIALIGAGHGEQTLANVFTMTKEEEKRFLDDLKKLADEIEIGFDIDYDDLG